MSDTTGLLVKVVAAPGLGLAVPAHIRSAAIGLRGAATITLAPLMTSIPARGPAGAGVPAGATAAADLAAGATAAAGLAAGETAVTGLAAGETAAWLHATVPVAETSPWDLAHRLCRAGADDLGLAQGHAIRFAEPDFEQQWIAPHPADPVSAAPRDPHVPVDQDRRFPRIAGDDLWYRDIGHSAFAAALAALAARGGPSRVVRVAHLDTGYDPNHRTLPTIRRDLARNFVDPEFPNDATDRVHGLLTNRGHGTGTLGILAGGDPTGGNAPIGAAPFVEVVPIRVANRVELFSNSAIARALDYVHSLKDDPATRIDIVTMSMGGLASQAWAEAINALYEAGIFVVTAAGNNYANAPTRNIVFPGRFNRVVAACGVMADGTAYADLAPQLMAGNYGPPAKMATAIAAATPNLPWARLGCPEIVDHDGAGTSSATPQVAAAAAIWLAGQATPLAYPAPWMKAEAIRVALFAGARVVDDRARLGRGTLAAAETLRQPAAAAAALRMQPPDNADFALLRVLLGDDVALAPRTPEHAMLELEALQLSQSSRIEALLPDPDLAPEGIAIASRRQIAAELASDPRTSRALRAALMAGAAGPAGGGAGSAGGGGGGGGAGGGGTPPLDGGTPPSSRIDTTVRNQHAAFNRRLAFAPPRVPPNRRTLRIFASDPASASDLATFADAQVCIDVPWEPLQPGPVGETIEVVDIDPASRAAYAPVDLDDPWIAATGLAPSETDPRFHQQMAYAVAARTIETFERALGRKALWAPRRPTGAGTSDGFVQRLRIYPHGLRMANAYYSPQKKALLLGYFPGKSDGSGPGVTTFAALSHDIIAHETAHALLDGLHRRYIEPTNADCLAFHEAFADLVAIFLHFTIPQAVANDIRATRGDLLRQNRLGQIAFQFGRSMGERGALRDYIGTMDAQGHWQPRPVRVTDYAEAIEPHARGAVLVAAVFDAFLRIYSEKARAIFRLASGGSGVVPAGELPPATVEALAQAASALARSFLNICIRALDYCPPIDITFPEYLRAMITADRDLVPDDPMGFRVAIAAAFRARGIAPPDVRSVSPDTLAWKHPEIDPRHLGTTFPDLLRTLDLGIDARDNAREAIYRRSQDNARLVHAALVDPQRMSDALVAMLGIERASAPMSQAVPGADGITRNAPGIVRGPEVHSVRALTRSGPDGTIARSLIVEITQSWSPTTPGATPARFRGGCTLVIDRDSGQLRYLVRKRVSDGNRLARQRAFAQGGVTGLRAAYFAASGSDEPFAIVHSEI